MTEITLTLRHVNPRAADVQQAYLNQQPIEHEGRLYGVTNAEGTRDRLGAEAWQFTLHPVQWVSFMMVRKGNVTGAIEGVIEHGSEDEARRHALERGGSRTHGWGRQVNGAVTRLG